MTIASGAKRDRVYCARAILDILEEPAQLEPVSPNYGATFPAG